MAPPQTALPWFQLRTPCDFPVLSLPQIKLIVCVLKVCVWEDSGNAEVPPQTAVQGKGPSGLWRGFKAV